MFHKLHHYTYAGREAHTVEPVLKEDPTGHKLKNSPLTTMLNVQKRNKTNCQKSKIEISQPRHSRGAQQHILICLLAFPILQVILRWISIFDKPAQLRSLETEWM